MSKEDDNCLTAREATKWDGFHCCCRDKSSWTLPLIPGSFTQVTALWVPEHWWCAYLMILWRQEGRFASFKAVIETGFLEPPCQQPQSHWGLIFLNLDWSHHHNHKKSNIKPRHLSIKSNEESTGNLIYKEEKRDTDVENKCMNSKGKERDGMNWEIGIDIYTSLTQCVKSVTNKNLLYSTGNFTLWWPKWEGNLKQRDKCASTADSLCSTAETNTTL